MKFYIENKLCFMFIYWLNLCQRFWGILSRYQLSHAYLSGHQLFCPCSRMWTAGMWMYAGICGVSASFKLSTNSRHPVACIFCYNIGVNFSPRRYKEGKSTDINSDELRSSAHLKKSIYSVAWVAKYLIVHLFGNCWSAVDSLESTLVPERWPTLETVNRTGMHQWICIHQ